MFTCTCTCTLATFDCPCITMLYVISGFILQPTSNPLYQTVQSHTFPLESCSSTPQQWSVYIVFAACWPYFACREGTTQSPGQVCGDSWLVYVSQPLAKQHARKQIHGPLAQPMHLAVYHEYGFRIHIHVLWCHSCIGLLLTVGELIQLAGFKIVLHPLPRCLVPR